MSLQCNPYSSRPAARLAATLVHLSSEKAFFFEGGGCVSSFDSFKITPDQIFTSFQQSITLLTFLMHNVHNRDPQVASLWQGYKKMSSLKCRLSIRIQKKKKKSSCGQLNIISQRSHRQIFMTAKTIR